MNPFAAMNTTPLRVALDAAPLLDPHTGVARYVRELGFQLEARGVDVRRYAVSLRGRNEPAIARLRAPARLVQGAWRRSGTPSVLWLTGPADIVHGRHHTAPEFEHTFDCN